MKDRFWGVLCTFMTLGLAACDIGQFTQSQETQEFVISITNDPHPIRVGQAVKLYATLRKQRAGVSGCRVSFSQRKVAMDDMSDTNWSKMEEGGRSGIYHGRTEGFNQSGDWVLKFKVNCTGVERILTFPYTVLDA